MAVLSEQIRPSWLFVGLGTMGFPMARHLAASGLAEIFVRNRSEEKCERWLRHCDGARDLPEKCYQRIFLCVGRDADVEAVLSAPAHLLQRLQSGGIVVDHSTTSPALSQRMATRVAQAGGYYVDAPVSGGQAGAEAGRLSCMLGGSETVCSALREALQCYCSTLVRIGEVSSGQYAKLANQLCIAGVLGGLSEAIMLLEQAEGVDKAAVLEALSGGAAQSWQMDNRFSSMVAGDYDFGFAVEHMHKDLGYALEVIRQQGWQAEVAALIYRRYAALIKDGLARHDSSALLEAYRRR